MSACWCTARKHAFFENRHPSERFAWFLSSRRLSGGYFFITFADFVADSCRGVFQTSFFIDFGVRFPMLLRLAIHRKRGLKMKPFGMPPGILITRPFRGNRTVPGPHYYRQTAGSPGCKMQDEGCRMQDVVCRKKRKQDAGCNPWPLSLVAPKGAGGLKAFGHAADPLKLFSEAPLRGF